MEWKKDDSMNSVYFQQGVTGRAELNPNIYLQLRTSIKKWGRSPQQGSAGQGDWASRRTELMLMSLRLAGRAGGSRVWAAARGDLSDSGVNKTCRGMLVATTEEASSIIHVE